MYAVQKLKSNVIPQAHYDKISVACVAVAGNIPRNDLARLSSPPPDVITSLLSEIASLDLDNDLVFSIKIQKFSYVIARPAKHSFVLAQKRPVDPNAGIISHSVKA